MLYSTIKLALRHLAKHRLFASINILGLATGLAVFVLSSLIVNYEYNHDSIFPKRERIFSVGSLFALSSGEPISEYPNVRLAYGPLFAQEIPEAELVARSILRERVVTTDNGNYYQGIRFVDPGFTRIFDFQYLHGDASAIDRAHGLILTASTAVRLFGGTDVVGEPLAVDHNYEMRIAAVIADLPADSHFNSSFLPDSSLSAIASVEALSAIDGFRAEGEWDSLNPADMTYILLPYDRDGDWLQQQVDAVAARHTPAEELAYIDGLRVRPLKKANTQIWDSLGFPVLESLQLLGLLVLVTACLNYINMATAQSFARTREVGLRKTFGASRAHLSIQFLTESFVLTGFAILLALAAVELLLPLYNEWSGRAVALDYRGQLPLLSLTAVAVGLLAGAYPAYVISRRNPIDGLRGILCGSRRGGFLRSLLVAAQFSISVFILAMVLIIHFQNDRMREIGDQFPRRQVAVLENIDERGMGSRHDALRRGIENVKGVEAAAFSSGVPYEAAGGNRKVTPLSGQIDRSLELKMISVDTDYFAIYGMEILAGRPLHSERTGDLFAPGVDRVNVVVNRMAAEELGLLAIGEGPEKAIGKSFYPVPGEDKTQPRHYMVVGLVPDQYFLGVHTAMRPLAFIIQPDRYQYLSVRLDGRHREQTLADIDTVWARVIADYPIRRKMLDFYFDLFFRIPEGIAQVLTTFAAVALVLALMGLFGLTAFMAQTRTREIGIRKVMGAGSSQVLLLMIWQFSTPVIWSLGIAAPLAYLASKLYLDFFPERIGFVLPAIGLAGAVAIATAWGIVAAHALATAGKTPADSLRCE